MAVAIYCSNGRINLIELLIRYVKHINILINVHEAIVY